MDILLSVYIAYTSDILNTSRCHGCKLCGCALNRIASATTQRAVLIRSIEMPKTAYVFTGVSRQAFERMKHDLRGLGVDVPDGDACVLDHRGVRGALGYSEQLGRVEVRILSKPFFVSSSAVESMLDRVMRRYAESGREASDSG